MLDISHLTKRFGPTTALDDVSFAVRRGEVRALVGENGAGKSTLVKILAGVYRADAGRIRLDGVDIDLRTPVQARASGINVIHQDRQLVPHMSGLENIFLGLPYPRRHGLFVDWAAMRDRVARVLDDLDLRLPLHRPVREMSPAEQTLLEIARAGLTEAKVLLLDEPTAALTDHEARRLFALIRRLRDQGVALIYVSHRLEEVLGLSDAITVLCNGRVAGQLATNKATPRQLVALITGREYQPARKAPPDQSAAPTPLLQVRDLSTRDDRVRGVSFTLHAGEVLGFFGLAGAGRTELLEAIYGLRPIRHGTVAVRGERPARPDPTRSLAMGVAMICEDRRANGLIPRHSVSDNMTLQTLNSFSRFGVLRRGDEARAVERQMALLDIRAEGPSQPIDLLSGGNQQKVLLARMLLGGPSILLCDEPTHAVDIGTRERIHTLLIEKARHGCGVVFVCSDLAELLEVVDRFIIMGAGRGVAELRPGQVGTAEIMRLCYEAEEAGHDRAG